MRAKYLLNTNALLRWLADDERLGEAARTAIRALRSDVLLSVVSLWEVIVKVRVGRLRVDLDVLLDVGNHDFPALGLREEHLQTLANLPVHHRDPFDHLLIAQAIAEDATFVTADRLAAAYPVRCLARA